MFETALMPDSLGLQLQLLEKSGAPDSGNISSGSVPQSPFTYANIASSYDDVENSPPINVSYSFRNNGDDENKTFGKW